MALVEINWRPSRTELRVFGAGLAVFCLVVGGVIFWRDRQLDWIEGLLAAIAGIASAITVFAPKCLYPVYCVFMVVTFPIGWVISHVILALVFYGVFTPIGLCLRLFGRDPMRRHWDSQAETYWVPHKTERPSEDYFRQF